MCASTSVISTPGNRRCTLAIATSSISVILKIRAHLKFSVSGRSKQASIDTHTHAQCSHASVGLAQIRPKCSCSTEHGWLS